MSEGESSGGNQFTEMLGAMGWVELPFGCFGLARHATAKAQSIWSWLIVIPWAANDSKPWIDGTKLFPSSIQTEDQERDDVIGHMREILDKRYGETVAKRAADNFIERFRSES